MSISPIQSTQPVVFDKAQKKNAVEPNIFNLRKRSLGETETSTPCKKRKISIENDQNIKIRPNFLRDTETEKTGHLFPYREKKEETGIDPMEIDQEIENELGELLQSNLVEMPSNSPFIDADLIILKNDYKGTMPLNGIKEEDFKEISILFEAICTNNSSLRIISDPPFSNKIQEAVKTLLTREIGRKLIRKICSFNSPILICKDERSEYVYYKNVINISKSALDNRELVNVMDPDLKGSRRRKLQGEQPVKAGFEPLFVVLAHEMIHATHCHTDLQMSKERMATKDEQYDTKEEKLTIEGFCLNSNGQWIYDELNERNLTGAFADKKQHLGYPRFDHSECREKLEIEGKIIYPDGRERGTKGSFFPDDSVLKEEFAEKGIQKGRMKYLDGSLEEGAFKNGKLLMGKIFIPKERLIEGTFEDEELNGKGKVTYYSYGVVLEGQFKNGQIHKGKITSSDGVAEGEFKSKKLDGQGKITSSNGMAAEGEFKNGELSGRGKVTFPNGTVTEGKFKSGKLDGQGKTTYSDGVAEGEFKDGILNGRGKTIYPDGTAAEGEFKDGILNGRGKTIYPNGAVAEGEFKSGILNGRGKSIYPDGIVLEGEFKSGVLNGQGKTIFPNGIILEGEFKSGKLDGQGKAIFT
jgi:hypothetical protein